MAEFKLVRRTIGGNEFRPVKTKRKRPAPMVTLRPPVSSVALTGKGLAAWFGAEGKRHAG